MSARPAPSMIVVANVPAATGARLVTVEAPTAWTFRVGQVVELATTPDTAGYFAIASAPSELGCGLSFLVKAGDSDSAPLMALSPGQAVLVRGPFGAGFELPAGVPPLLFVTAGSALGAVRSAIVERLAERRADRIALVVGARTLADLAFADELARWQAAGVRVRVALSGGDPPALWPLPIGRGRAQAQLADLAGPGTHAFIAGSEALEDEVTAALIAHGVSPENIQRNYRPDSRGP